MTELAQIMFFLLISVISLVELSTYPTGVILTRDIYRRCKDVDLHTQRLVCEIHSQEDEMKIERFGLSGCYGSTLSCAEGDIKTCMPLMTINTLHYQCFCRIDEASTSTVPDYQWTGWQMFHRHFQGFRYGRKLIVDNGIDSVAEEYSRITPDVHLVANYTLPDSVYSASASLGVHNAYRARVDAYFDFPCTWAAGSSDGDPWLKISLPDKYMVSGVYIKRRCDNPVQRPTMVDVKTSSDDVIWQDIITGFNVEERYTTDDEHGSADIWFSDTYTTQYWKIIIIKYESYSAMKCDLLGYSI